MSSGKKQSDPRGGHIRLYWEIVDSNAWRCLTASDQRTYLALRRSLLSFNNGDLSLPHSVAKRHGISNQSTLAKSLRALVAVGLIAVTREGGSKAGGQRLPTLYRFTDEAVHAMPAKFIEATRATNDWKAVTTIDLGCALIRHAEEKASEKWAKQQATRVVNKVARQAVKN